MSTYMPRIPQAITLIDWLGDHPNATIRQIDRALAEAHGEYHTPAPALIAFTRNVVGEEVIRCDRHTTPPTYRLAMSAADSYEYVVERKRKVRNEASNLVGMLDRTEKKYPGDAGVRVARAMLSSVVAMLDATE